jgi:NhaD family Na+/H+ antiporter
MLAILPLIIFVIGYVLIVLEHPLRLNKTVPALLIGVLIWAVIYVGQLATVGSNAPEAQLLHHLGKIAEIVFFLKGAMTIVELIDLHRGFEVVTQFIRTENKLKMLWIVSFGAFFLSAVLDNLTTTIVLVSLIKKLLPEKEDRLWFASIVIIAANAGGAWSPIGDVTTTMLWIGQKTSATLLIRQLFLPSLVCLLVPLAVLSFLPRFRKKIIVNNNEEDQQYEQLLSSRLMLSVGLGALIFVPIFKSVTHLPPYMGMLLALSVVWLLSEYIHPEENFDEERRHLYSAQNALSRVDFASILFFVGILLAIAGLETLGSLHVFAEWLNHLIGDKTLIVIVLGAASAVIDNVPLVAAAMGMYQDPMDADFWHLIAYTCGTGGSMLIIGSAAGVAAMGLEKIDFIWYFKNIAWLAALGYFAGVAMMLIA